MKKDKFKFPWWYFSITCPLAGAIGVYLLVADRIWVRGWVYKSEEPYLYWFFFACAVYGFVGAGYKGIKAFQSAEGKI